jgi:predicted GIY-YIG superfamily endonuclease
MDDDSLAGGANHAAKVEEQIEECDDIRYEDIAFHKRYRGQDEKDRTPRLQHYVVYVIKCHIPTDFNTLWEVAEDKLDREPYDYDIAAYHSDQVFYVGYGQNPYNRIQEHVNRGKSSEFFDIFPPYRLLDLEFFGEKEEAKNREGDRAEELNENEDHFAYSDQYDPS